MFQLDFMLRQIQNKRFFMINIVICDDNTEYREIICRKINNVMTGKFKMEYSITETDNLNELKKYLEKGDADILFLDIMLNDKNTVDWSIENIKSNSVQIIFMTSFPQCAYNLSESPCCYYLIKSKITADSLAKALKRALQNISKKEPNLSVVKSGNKNVIINYQDIEYIESSNNNVVINLRDGNSVSIYSSLKEYYDTLPPNFLKCHKSYIVNMNHIRSYEKFNFLLDTGASVPIPPKKYLEIINIYYNYITII